MGDLLVAGFGLLPTFSVPHCGVAQGFDTLEQPELLVVAGDPVEPLLTCPSSGCRLLCGILGRVEIIVELVLELVMVSLNITLGLGLAVASYWVWVTVRRRVWGLDQTVVVETPAGDRYGLDVPGLRLRTPLSRRIFGLRQAPEGSAPQWDTGDRLHPDRVAGAAEDLLVFIVPFLLVGVLFLVLLFVLEMILVAIVLGLVAIVATIIRHKWTCLVTGPEGQIFRVRARGMRRVRRLRHEIAAAIRAGDIEALGLAENC